MGTRPSEPTSGACSPGGRVPVLCLGLPGTTAARHCWRCEPMFPGLRAAQSALPPPRGCRYLTQPNGPLPQTQPGGTAPTRTPSQCPLLYKGLALLGWSPTDIRNSARATSLLAFNTILTPPRPWTAPREVSPPPGHSVLSRGDLTHEGPCGH